LVCSPEAAASRADSRLLAPTPRSANVARGEGEETSANEASGGDTSCAAAVRTVAAPLIPRTLLSLSLAERCAVAASKASTATRRRMATIPSKRRLQIMGIHLP
jgi:hypothetical protein